jgi:hypothetical protein
LKKPKKRRLSDAVVAVRRRKLTRANMEHMMNENTHLTRRDTWMARIWKMLIDLDEAISTSPLEHLERRVVALEKKVWGSGDPLASRNQNLKQ